MVTMADVGRVAGVSASTVSHVLNGTRTVSETTRRLVLEAVSSTGYRHNVLARSLATSSTMALGVAISSVDNPYFSSLMRSLETRARAAGYMLMLGDTYDDVDSERHVVEQLIDRRVDGILLAPAPGSSENTLPFLRSTGVPTVLLDRFADADVDQVAPENLQATANLADHLADLGHRRVAMVAGRRGLHSTTERVAGFWQVVERRGLDDDLTLVVTGDSTAPGAEYAVRSLFAEVRPAPTAVVVGNNAMTIGTMRALRGLGLRVPADIAVVCYDDFEWADVFEPRLTAVSQDVTEMGVKALDLIVRRIADPSAPRERHRVQPSYQHRTSCGCPSTS